MVESKSVVERVNKAWDRLEAWYAKNAPEWTLSKGATDEEIDSLAKHLNVTLPEEFRVSLKRHNGIEDLKWPMTWLLSTKEIQRLWDSWVGMEGENDDLVESDGTFQKKFWCRSWVQIDSDGGSSNGNVIDLAPGPKGHIGQILFFDHGEGPSGPTYPDLAAYLEDMATKLEEGKYIVDDDRLADNEDENEGEENGSHEEDEDESEEDDEVDKEEEKSKSKKKVKK